ncbi:HlyD family type I secretion periplasmic adaptor subunit [Duganella sp. BJB488]|uniref:HlyD family type I secretion periplasmic adaptor subunit n=1 Tax=unclassified Duganella TaxID=2636909 RepID=UPI000E356DE8|nr:MULTISPECIES: HlyD family type I secretion periplasmic adaptor subunit [unclassified Duganella]RFP26176.1 HlyD family type I secretion periplasmic adaptor subunit [Duganella sp. BJB489]RFP28084.1 HlyD family type I secretion periplasmic adaptor subunit [Duganella sp. BJB488]RFP37107.1 HlyD family type I secretion periplasmic adaptor subunit [Duganella sp. BJB480]
MVNIVKKQEPATEVISHDVEPLTVNTDAGAYARVGWAIVLFGVLGFLVWAIFAPLDKGVPMQATVAKESNRQAIQYLQNGIVKDILVKDGDVVKAGQVLVRMNNVQVKSAMDITRVQYVSARATEARLQAELSGQKSINLPASLLPYKDEPAVIEAMTLQNQLLASRQGSLHSELGGADENIEGLRSQISGLQQSRDNKKDQLAMLKEQLDNSRDLAKEGYLARNRLLEVERTYSQVNGAIAEDVGNIGRAQRQIMELTLRKQQRNQDYQKEVRTQLADTQKEAEALQGRLDAQKFDVASVDVKSPVDGVVVGSNVFTRGGIVAAGSRMMEIVPTADALVVEGQLPVNLIDKVHPGLKVELIFSAFNANKTPHIPGEVIQVAADRTVDERSGAAYYKVRARVSAEGSKLIQKEHLAIVSGMPVEMFVKTGERSMMSYLLKPVFDRAKTSMTEE